MDGAFQEYKKKTEEALAKVPGGDPTYVLNGLRSVIAVIDDEKRSLILGLLDTYDRAVDLVEMDTSLSSGPSVARKLFGGVIRQALDGALKKDDIDTFIRDTQTEDGIREVLVRNQLRSPAFRTRERRADI